MTKAVLIVTLRVRMKQKTLKKVWSVVAVLILISMLGTVTQLQF